MTFITEPLNSLHKKAQFSCGKPALDVYLQKQAKQDVKRFLSVCFIMAESDGRVKGYYTLSNASINKSFLPETMIKRLPPSYTNLPATLLGRLAVDSGYKGQGLGALLLIDALKRCYEASLEHIGSMAVIVDPLDEDAVKFYYRYGFILLPDSGKLFLPMSTITSLFK